MSGRQPDTPTLRTPEINLGRGLPPAAWIEFLLLRRWLARRIGHVPVPVRLGLGALAAALLAGGVGYAAGQLAASAGAADVLSDLIAIGGFGVTYLGITIAAGVPEAAAFTRRLRQRR